MENAAEALKMAAAILIFMIAITSSFSLFGTAKATADSIITMRDKQAYLEAAELESILYTSSNKISTYNNFTAYGDRIVGINDVVSTIYRYSIEKYGVTIINSNRDVLARFDTNTETFMNNWDSIESGENSNGEFFTADEIKETYTKEIRDRLNTVYINSSEINLDLEELFEIANSAGQTKRGAPWGNYEEICERIKIELFGGIYVKNGLRYDGENDASGIISLMEDKTIVEVTNEVDQSKYLEDGGEKTNLLQQYNMPTLEIIYIILD